MRKIFAAVIIQFLISTALCFAETVEFYGTVSSSGDESMIKMTTEVLYAQFQSLDGYSVIDKRNETYSSSTNSANICFYAELQEDIDGKWICTLNACRNDRTFSLTKKYDSYNRILLDSKASLRNLMINLSANMNNADALPDQRDVTADEGTGTIPPRPRYSAIDNIAGTWTGEDNIEKILILRGGRGFIVFKNGAQMNISVSVDNPSVTIKQVGRPNASFFPELPRQDVMKVVVESNPIEWNFTINGNTLEGTKKTLIADSKSATGISEGTVKVQWTKQR